MSTCTALTVPTRFVEVPTVQQVNFGKRRTARSRQNIEPCRARDFIRCGGQGSHKKGTSKTSLTQVGSLVPPQMKYVRLENQFPDWTTCSSSACQRRHRSRAITPASAAALEIRFAISNE